MTIKTKNRLALLIVVSFMCGSLFADREKSISVPGTQIYTKIPAEIQKFQDVNTQVIEKITLLNNRGPAEAVRTPWDVNGDGEVNIFDLILVAKHFGESVSQAAISNVKSNNREIDIFDMALVASHFGEKVEPFDTTNYLVSQLDSDGYRVAIDAAKALYDLGDERGIAIAREKVVWPRIIELTNSDPWVTQTSQPYKDLVELGQISVEPLMKNLHDPTAEPDTRKWSAKLLGVIGEFEEVFNVLVEVIENKDGIYQWWIVVEANSGMSELLKRQSKERVLELKNHPNSTMRRLVENILQP